jgi:hypothetical protein
LYYLTAGQNERKYMLLAEWMPVKHYRQKLTQLNKNGTTLVDENGRKKTRRTIANYLRKTCIVALLGLPALSVSVMASEDPPGDVRSAISLDEIALELSNPATALGSIANDFEFRPFQGDLPGSDDQSAWRYVLTPSWAFKLSNGKNLFLRATIPLNADQPLWRADRSYAEFLIRQSPAITPSFGRFITGHDHMDDIEFLIGYGGVNENGFFTTLGLAAVVPTSEDRSTSRDLVLLGPEFSLGQVTRWGLIGAKAKHLTSVAREDQWETNETTVKIFFAYGLGNGWQIESNPIIYYDWEAVSGNEWTVPIGAGVSKTMMVGSVPLKLAFEIQKYVVTPDRFGPEWLLRFSLTPVLSR